MPRFQRTLGGKVSLEGIGLHTGINCNLALIPADENHGIVFRRTDLNNKPIVPADIDYVVGTNRGTILEKAGTRIYTVEHVLAALYGLGINNTLVELSGPEPPIIDGSALPFVDAIEKVGIIKQHEIQNTFHITEPIRFCDNERNIEINVVPSEKFKITFFMDYRLANFGLQYTSLEDVEQEFAKEIAPARTFGLLSEIADLKQNGLIKGGSLDNAVVVVDKKVNEYEQKKLSILFGIKDEFTFKVGDIVNSGGLKFANELVRHKVSDLIGDVALFGKPIAGHIIATRSGHRTNIELIRKLREMVKS